MKTFIVFITILALVCLHATGTKLVSTTKEEYLKELNELRRSVAKKYQIPNMYKLFWDDILAEDSLVDNKVGFWKTQRETWCDSDPLVKVRDLDSDLAKENRTALIKEYDRNFMSELELLTPGQQRIGCIEWHKWYQYSNDFYVIYKTYCYLEPDGTGNSWNMSQGEPGSACARGFKNDNGLCSPVIEPEPALTRTTKEEYLKDLNELRRNAAKKYQIPNMYELFWDYALAEERLANNYSGLWETKRETWRDSDPFVVVRHLDSDLAIDNRAALVAEYNRKFMSELEVLTPGQQRIGCIPWFERKDNVAYHTRCFIEPDGTGNSWNMSQGEPGSACAQRFENNDGLCSPAPPTTPTPEPTTPTPEPTTPKPKIPQTKIVAPKPTAPPKASRLGSDSDSTPAQDSDLPTDGASYAQIGTAFLFLISMIF
ncbi:unnamed protein product [Caenorhabditis nigoni]